MKASTKKCLKAATLVGGFDDYDQKKPQLFNIDTAAGI